MLYGKIGRDGFIQPVLVNVVFYLIITTDRRSPIFINFAYDRALVTSYFHIYLQKASCIRFLNSGVKGRSDVTKVIAS